jgi:hypothetical protein
MKVRTHSQLYCVTHNLFIYFYRFGRCREYKNVACPSQVQTNVGKLKTKPMTTFSLKGQKSGRFCLRMQRMGKRSESYVYKVVQWNTKDRPGRESLRKRERCRESFFPFRLSLMPSSGDRGMANQHNVFHSSFDSTSFSAS